MTTTYFKAVNKKHSLVMSPEFQLFDDADDATLLSSSLLFGTKEAAEQAASRILDPKFKVVAVSI
jgi:hypothetical protein